MKNLEYQNNLDHPEQLLFYDLGHVQTSIPQILKNQHNSPSITIVYTLKNYTWLNTGGEH